jgi:hypothetical protein
MGSDEVGATAGRRLVARRRFHDGLECAADGNKREQNEGGIEEGTS